MDFTTIRRNTLRQYRDGVLKILPFYNGYSSGGYKTKIVEDTVDWMQKYAGATSFEDVRTKLGTSSGLLERRADHMARFKLGLSRSIHDVQPRVGFDYIELGIEPLCIKALY